MEIIIQTKPGPETEFEGDYIYNFCLADIDKIKSERRIVVFSSNRREKIPNNVKKDDIIVHLSNENLKYNYHFLSSQNVILRSYYNPFIWHPNCYAIPLGWQSGMFNNQLFRGGHNRYKGCFIGQIKGYRKPMYESFKSDPLFYFSVSKQWNSQTLSDREVQQIYLDSAFALVPFGSIHADTMRIMEVLEWGCIPVVIKYMHEDYFKYIYGNHPFIICSNWNDAQRMVDLLWENKKALKQKQEEIYSWYLDYKRRLQADIRDILEGKKPSRCEQWNYQKLGRVNPWMLLTYYYHFYFKKQPIY